jgi:hypothetical protein
MRVLYHYQRDCNPHAAKNCATGAEEGQNARPETLKTRFPAGTPHGRRGSCEILTKGERSWKEPGGQGGCRRIIHHRDLTTEILARLSRNQEGFGLPSESLRRASPCALAVSQSVRAAGPYHASHRSCGVGDEAASTRPAKARPTRRQTNALAPRRTAGGHENRVLPPPFLTLGNC